MPVWASRMNSRWQSLVIGMAWALSVIVTGCGVQTPHSLAHRNQVPIAFIRTNHLPYLPQWMKTPGVSTVDEGFATGYMLNATHNILVWQKGPWRFQVEGPLVVSAQIRMAHQLYHTFFHVPLPKKGVIALVETHRGWTSMISYAVAGHRLRYRTASFPVTGANIDLVKVILQSILDGPMAYRHSMTCDVRLTIHHLQVHDKVLRCD